MILISGNPEGVNGQLACLIKLGGDQVVGLGLVGLAGVIFVYYTLWVIILPFVGDDQEIHKYFLPRTYALSIPLIAGVIALAAIGLFVVTLKLKAKKKKTS